MFRILADIYFRIRKWRPYTGLGTHLVDLLFSVELSSNLIEPIWVYTFAGELCLSFIDSVDEVKLIKRDNWWITETYKLRDKL